MRPEYIRAKKSIFEGKLDVNLVSKVNSIDIDDNTDLYIAKKVSS